jgi:2-methylcitrate dehydratase
MKRHVLQLSVSLSLVAVMGVGAVAQRAASGQEQEPAGPPTDTAAWALARYAVGLTYENLPKDVVEITKRHILDTIGCALGAYSSNEMTILRTGVMSEGGTPESTVIGSGQKTNASNAALINGNMIRYLDFNDTYWSKRGYMHPSNTLAEALAMTERQKGSGKDLILATVLGYEVQNMLIDDFDFPGFQQHSGAGFAAPVVAGKLLQLTPEQMANAIGISASTNFVLSGVYGMGFTSMMKSYGYASGSRAGVTAAILAQKGFTGPVTIVESYERNFEKGNKLNVVTSPQKDFAVSKAWFKPYEAYHVSHTSISAVIQLMKQDNIQPDQVDNVFIKGLPSRTNTERRRLTTIPRTKEEADHNLGFLIAMAVLDGQVGPDQYAKQQWKDPKVRQLISKVETQGDAELAKDFPAKWTCIVEIKTKDGKVHTLKLDLPKGGPGNPLTDQEIESKFRNMASKLMPASQVDQIIKTVYGLDSLTSVSDLTKLLVVAKS